MKTSIEICMTSTPVQCDLTFDLTSQIRLQEIDSNFVYNSPTSISSIANPHDKSLDHFTMCYTLSHSQTQFVYFYVFFSLLLFPTSPDFYLSLIWHNIEHQWHTHTHTYTHTHTRLTTNDHAPSRQQTSHSLIWIDVHTFFPLNDHYLV